MHFIANRLHQSTRSEKFFGKTRVRRRVQASGDIPDLVLPWRRLYVAKTNCAKTNGFRKFRFLVFATVFARRLRRPRKRGFLTSSRTPKNSR